MAKHYDRELKVEAVKLASEPGMTQAQVEKNLGIGKGVISRWEKHYALDGDHAFPGKGKLKPKDEAYRQLQRENERLRRERDILKKAVAIFSEDPYRYLGS